MTDPGAHWKLVKTWTDKLKGNIKDRSEYPTFPDGTMMGPFSRGGMDRDCGSVPEGQSRDIPMDRQAKAGEATELNGK